MELVFADSHPV